MRTELHDVKDLLRTIGQACPETAQRHTAVTSFEPGTLDRYGTEPDRFVEQMRQVWLPTTIGDDRAADSMIALLQMLTVALGIRVPRDLALGPLLTVQRETALPRPQPQPRPQFTTEPVTQAWQLRSHLQRLIDGGVTHDAIYAQSGYRLCKHSIDAILRGAGTFSILAETAEQVLAIEVPPNA